MVVHMVPWLVAMGALIACSAFFSASEAALFYLRWDQRQALRDGAPGERVAWVLMSDPDRLLSAVLFWNLVINITYFAIASIVGLKLEAFLSGSVWVAWGFSAAALLLVIFCSEMVPKSVAVLLAPQLAGWVGPPLAVAVRLVDPLMPLLRVVNLLSQRLLWPGFRAEPYLELVDLERAIDLSRVDAHVLEQERAALQNMIALSDIRVDEWMRPRTQFRSFTPPVALADLRGQLPPSGYLLITEPASEEVARALRLRELRFPPAAHLERLAKPVAYAPWCTTVAEVFDMLRQRDLEVAVIVNERGETIGILTFDDILSSVFTYEPSRSKLLLDRQPIHTPEPGVWIIAGVTSLRRLSRYLEQPLPPSQSVTLLGAVQESLERVAHPGDEGTWGPFQFRILQAPQGTHLLVELRQLSEQPEQHQ